MTILLAIFAVIVMIPILIAAARNDKQLIEWGVPRAVEIARYQNWGSPHRLMTQAHMTKSAAQSVLRVACKRGLLVQAVNGRYYVPGCSMARLPSN